MFTGYLGPIGAVGLDWDEVVVRSSNVHTTSWLAAAQEILGGSISDEQWARLTRDLYGLPEPDFADALALALNQEGTGIRFSEARERYLKSSNPEIPLVDGIKDLIELLRERKIPFGINTSSCRYFVEWCIGRTGLGELLQGCPIVSAEDGNALGHYKPSKLPWTILWERLGVLLCLKAKVALDDSLPNAQGAVVSHKNAWAVVPQSGQVLNVYRRDLARTRHVVRRKVPIASRISITEGLKPVIDFIAAQ